MNQITNFNPNWSSAPGNTINDILSERNIQISEFARQMNESQDGIIGLLNGNISIDQNIANKLTQTLGASKEFWIQREQQYRESLKHLKLLKDSWMKNLPLKEMINLGWIEKSDNNFSKCLDYFGVNNIRTWNEKYSIEIGQLSFRTSNTYDSDFASIAAWLRRGEIITRNLECKAWNKEKFVSTLEEIKKLTRLKSPERFLPQLIRKCSECGVAVAVVPTPKGCKASGATKFISKTRALLLLSFRYLSDDHFWFTFFHEAGHLVLHESKSVHIEIDKKIKRVENDEEKEANIFAAESLVPFTLHDRLKNIRSNKRKLIRFAADAGISPGIVVGQMQYLGYIKYEYLNGYKRRYNWDDINSAFFYE